MKTRKHAWKVVRSQRGFLVSAVIGIDAVTYRKNQFVYEDINNVGLFVFQTRAQARRFKQVQNRSDFQIWKAEILNGRPGDIDGNKYPTGTVLCDAVKLLHKA